MLDSVWPTLPSQLRDELISQCVRALKSDADAYDHLAQMVAGITKSRMETVKSQWRIGNYYGTKLAIAREPDKVSPALAMTFLAARKTEVAALYNALGVEHADLVVSESAITGTPPTQAQFAAILRDGADGITKDIARCMIAVIADAGIDQWQDGARNAIAQYMESARTV